MERYTQFRDKATGISPFMPVTQTNVIGVSDSPVQSFIKKAKLDLLAKLLLFALRLILIAPFFALSFLLSPLLGTPLLRPLNRLILLIAGLTSYELSVQNLKTKNLNRQTFFPSRNDVYFVNFSSPFEVLILLLVSNDKFALLLPNKNGDLREVSTFALIQKSLSGYLPNDDISTPLNYNSFKNKIIYVFAEGTTSNGKAILPFLLKQSTFDAFFSHLSEDKKTHKIKSLGIKIYPSTLVTPLNYSRLEYLFKALTTLTYNVKLRVNTVNELNAFDTSLSKIRSSFTNNGKFKLVNEELDANSKLKFIDAYIGRK